MATITLEQALSLQQQGKVKQAYALLQELHQSEPTNPTLLELLATCAAQQGLTETAIEHVMQCIALNPGFAPYYNNLGQLQLQQRSIKKAQKAFNQALSIDPTYANAMNNLGSIALKSQQWDNAIAHYEQAISIDPTFADPYFNLSLVYCHLNSLPKAQTYCQQAIECDPTHARALGQLGEIHLNQNQYDLAIALFKQRLAIQPRHTETWHSIGLAYQALKQWDEANNAFRQCLSNNDQHRQANHDLANILTLQGDHDTALHYYYRQLTIQAIPETYYNIGVLLMYQERSKDAVDYLQQALTLNPNNVDAHVNLASLHLKHKDKKQAQHHYEAALELSPDNEEIPYILTAITQSSPPQRAPNAYLTSLFNQYAQYYDQHLVRILRYRVPEQLFDAVTEHSNNTNFKTLDLGCGTGICGKQFKAISSTLIGVDVSEDMIAIARHKDVYHQLVCQDIDTYLAQPQQHDLILAGDVFSYFGDLATLFTRCNRSLAPGGLFAFTVEKSDQPGYCLQETIRYAHHQAYIKDTLQQCGLTLLHFSEQSLREQQKKPLRGYVVVAQSSLAP